MAKDELLVALPFGKEANASLFKHKVITNIKLKTPLIVIMGNMEDGSDQKEINQVVFQY